MTPNKFTRISKSTEKMLKAIPADPTANVEFRKELHKYLCEDKSAAATYMALCFLDPVIFFNSALWTFNSQLKYKHIPFILWPHQSIAVRRIKDALETGKDVFFKKSRKQGATYINLGVFLLYFLINQDERFFLGSRKESLVDDGSEIMDGRVVGSEETLFYKLLYMLNTLPKYLQPSIYKKHLFMQNMSNGAAFKGEATNIGFGKAFRSRGTLVDEAAQIDPKEAEWIIENLADTSPTTIFNSTSGPWGEAHPYSKLMAANPDKVIELSFYDNPEQCVGRYTSPGDGKIIIKDIDYYRQKYIPEFRNIEADVVYSLDELPTSFPFIADGNVSNFGCDRTAWLDEFERDKAITPRGKAQNLLMIDSGSTQMFFQFGLIDKLRERVRPPYYTGDVGYSLDKDGYVCETWFEASGTNGILSWWDTLRNGRPNQGHNYVVGCDISKGTGTSNSVAAVLDVNTDEIVGLLVTPYLSISDFAEKVVALCTWIGGNNLPLLIWEENGAPDFLWRVNEMDYYNLYVKEDRMGKRVKGGNRFGWRSTHGINGTKVEMMNALDAALHEGLRENPRFAPIHVYDNQVMNELEGYVWFEGRIDVGPATMQTDTSGAKAGHGDRVIATGLSNKGRSQQTLGSGSEARLYAESSWAARKADRERKQEEQRVHGKRWYI